MPLRRHGGAANGCIVTIPVAAPPRAAVRAAVAAVSAPPQASQVPAYAPRLQGITSGATTGILIMAGWAPVKKSSPAPQLAEGFLGGGSILPDAGGSGQPGRPFSWVGSRRKG
jgi:hypothetical protein